jgi:uracil DNA glycosylase
MSIEACIAHAIHNDLDIIEALPEIHSIPMEELEIYIEQYVLEVQSSLCDIILGQGEPYLKSKDAAGLCATCLESGIELPPSMLLRMCQTILQLSTVDARFILDTEDGKSLYYVKVAV